jgi:hypothetical protein
VHSARCRRQLTRVVATATRLDDAWRTLQACNLRFQLLRFAGKRVRGVDSDGQLQQRR